MQRIQLEMECLDLLHFDRLKPVDNNNKNKKKKNQFKQNQLGVGWFEFEVYK